MNGVDGFLEEMSGIIPDGSGFNTGDVLYVIGLALISKRTCSPLRVDEIGNLALADFLCGLDVLGRCHEVENRW